MFALTASAALAAPHESIVYTFTDGTDGGGPNGRLALDTAGNLYGTTHFGGIVTCGGQVGGGCGTVYELKPNGKRWTQKPLYAFADGPDGGFPNAGVTLAGGNIYGTASTGGSTQCSIGCGVIYEIINPSSPTEHALYTFHGSDGQFPNAALYLGAGARFYGTTWYGGANGVGTVFVLYHASGTWAEAVLYSFAGAQGGDSPAGGVVTDQSGNLFGTTYPYDGDNDGVAFELQGSGSTWSEGVIDTFQSGAGGEDPYAGLTIDASGNLYGTTIEGGSSGSGVVFELERHGKGFREKVLHTFTGSPDGSTPYAGLTLDFSGNLYGATLFGGSANDGTVYELARGPNGHFKERVLHSFAGGNDGANPQAEPILDASGRLYGTTENGGADGAGIVYELTP
jgi:uncharacterized repeat protein (TIGR03803 family)